MFWQGDGGHLFVSGAGRGGQVGVVGIDDTFPFSARLLFQISTEPHVCCLRSFFQLAAIFGRVEMPLRGRKQAVRSNTPTFETADADLAPRASRAGVRPAKRPVILRPVLGQPQFVHQDAKIRERRHKGLRQLCDCVPSDRRRIVIDAERSLIGVKCSNAPGITAAPCRCVASREIPYINRVRHRVRFYQFRLQQRCRNFLLSSRTPSDVIA